MLFSSIIQIKSIKELKELYLSNNEITDSCIELLLDAIVNKNYSSLEIFDISSTEITDVATGSILHSFEEKCFNNLKSLILHSNNITDYGLWNLKRCLTDKSLVNCLHLHVLDLHCIYIYIYNVCLLIFY